MPTKCEKRDGKWRLVNADTGKIETTDNGNAVDGGGHETKGACQDQSAAINANKQAADDGQRWHTVAIKATDNKKQIVYGEVYVPYSIDAAGEYMEPEDVEKMAHRALTLDLQAMIDTHHDNQPNGSYPVESFVAREGDPDFLPGAWVLGVKVPNPHIWDQVEKGELNSFSMEALVKPKAKDVILRVMRDHLGETKAGGDDDHTHLFFVQLDYLGRVKEGYTDRGPDGHFHVLIKSSVTEPADDGHVHRFAL